MNPMFQLFGRKAGANTMNIAKWSKLPACLSALSLLLLAGCSAEDSRIVALRQRLLLAAEPSDATTIAIAKDAVAKNPDVSIVAQVSADEREGFIKGQAAFLVTEVRSGEDRHCEDTDCPFCAKDKVKILNAAVKFIGETGAPLAVDARDLFGIRPGDTVVIQGKGEVMPGLDMLQVTAKHIFVRSREETSR